MFLSTVKLTRFRISIELRVNLLTKKKKCPSKSIIHICRVHIFNQYLIFIFSAYNNCISIHLSLYLSIYKDHHACALT